MPTANEILRDRGIRHALYLTRVSSRQANQIRRLLEDASVDIGAQIDRRLRRINQRGRDLGPATTARLKEFDKASSSLLSGVYGEAYEQLELDLFKLAETEAAFQAGLVRVASPVVVDLVAPAPSTLRAIVRTRPFQGAHLREWFGDLEAAQRTAIRRAVNLGIVEGEPIDVIVRRIRGTARNNYTDGILEIGRRQAEGVVRTAVNHVSTAARGEFAAANSDLVDSEQIVATLDSRTTPICQKRDGEVYPVGQGPRPPFHIGCRTTVIPVLKSWRKQGLALDDAPAGTRASLDGQVPAKIKYPEWIEKQSFDVKREALGTTRARLLETGKVKATAFVDRRGRQFTLDELRRREADAFAALDSAAQ